MIRSLSAAVSLLVLSSSAHALDCAPGQSIERKVAFAISESGKPVMPDEYSFMTGNLRVVSEVCISGEKNVVYFESAPEFRAGSVRDLKQIVVRLLEIQKLGGTADTIGKLMAHVAVEAARAEQPKPKVADTGTPEDFQTSIFGGGPKKK